MKATFNVPGGIKTITQSPEISKYYNDSGAVYNDINEVNSQLPNGIRYIGLTVNVNNEEYWYKDGIDDINLVLKGGGIGIQNSILTNNKIDQDLTIDLEYTSSLTIQSDPLTSTKSPHFSMDTNHFMSSYNGPYISLGIIDDTFSPYGGMYSGFRIGSDGYDFSHFISAHILSGRSIELEITDSGYDNFNWNSLVNKGYVMESHVSQITITASTVLTSVHHGKTIYVENGASDIVITVDGGSHDSIYENGDNYIKIFKTDFVQKGTGLVSFTASSVVLNLPEVDMNKIKGKNYRVLLEYQYTSGTGQNQYTLFGDLIV